MGFGGEILADEALREGQFVAGANRTGWHLRGVEHGRDFEARFADIREPREGDSVPQVRRAPGVPDRARGRAHLQARHRLLGAARRDLPRRGRHGAAARHGQLRHRAGRGSWRRQSSSATTRSGIAWPRSLAPYDVEVVAIGAAGAEAIEIAERAAEAFDAAGLEVLLDDRDLRPGEKFADADLFGCPVRVTVGKKTLEDGKADVLKRSDRSEERVAVDGLVDYVKEAL